MRGCLWRIYAEPSGGIPGTGFSLPRKGLRNSPTMYYNCAARSTTSIEPVQHAVCCGLHLGKYTWCQSTVLCAHFEANQILITFGQPTTEGYKFKVVCIIITSLCTTLIQWVRVYLLSSKCPLQPPVQSKTQEYYTKLRWNIYIMSCIFNYDYWGM